MAVNEEVGVDEDDGFMLEMFGDTGWTAPLQRKAREEGREEGREEFLTEILISRFGPVAGLAEVADRLAAWPPAQALAAIHAAATLRDIPVAPEVDLRDSRVGR